ncbi:basic salivary proline-rich protein 1-like [Antechinus flavipes]|uniref:basic salivary proline-rich protein 1-like n=1 Tax=Antechinus flavipes TaxID=38775 RepID=UPI00223656E1|nr:basic salivary proline-rich protein 1-like [Antechinus flavipes]
MGLLWAGAARLSSQLPLPPPQPQRPSHRPGKGGPRGPDESGPAPGLPGAPPAQEREPGERGPGAGPQRLPQQLAPFGQHSALGGSRPLSALARPGQHSCPRQPSSNALALSKKLCRGRLGGGAGVGPSAFGSVAPHPSASHPLAPLAPPPEPPILSPRGPSAPHPWAPAAPQPLGPPRPLSPHGLLTPWPPKIISRLFPRQTRNPKGRSCPFSAEAEEPRVQGEP